MPLVAGSFRDADRAALRPLCAGGLCDARFFCRNCLSKWYRAAAGDRGLDLTYEDAREIVYGMPYADWKAAHQTEATPEQNAAYAEAHKADH